MLAVRVHRVSLLGSNSKPPPPQTHESGWDGERRDGVGMSVWEVRKLVLELFPCFLFFPFKVSGSTAG